MYWVDSNGNSIKRANLDGTDVQSVIAQTSLRAAWALELDLTNQKMYWTNRQPGEIMRANLNGGGIESVLHLGAINTNPIGLALDVADGRMYWTDMLLEFDPGKIQPAYLDGSGVEDLVEDGLWGPMGIALDFGPGPGPWPSNASFSLDSDLNILNLDFGTLNPGDAASPESFSIWNIASAASADLNLDSITASGDTGILATDLTTFTGLSPGASQSYLGSFDTSTIGDFSASYTLSFSDVTGQPQPSLTLSLSGKVAGGANVIPEPSAFLIWSLLGIAAGFGAWRRRRKR